MAKAAPTAAIKAIGAGRTVINDPSAKFDDVIYNNLASTNEIEGSLDNLAHRDGGVSVPLGVRSRIG